MSETVDDLAHRVPATSTERPQQPDAGKRVKRFSSKARTGCRTCRARRIKCGEERPSCLKCTRTGRECGGYEVTVPVTAQSRALLPRPADSRTIVPRPVAAPIGQVQPGTSTLDAQAFDYFRLKTAPALAGHFSTNVWERLVLQLCQGHELVRNASVAVGSLLYFRSSGPGCLTLSKPAKAHHDLALSSYSKALSGLRSYIEQQGDYVNEEVTLVVLVSCLLFVCFEMLQGDQKLTISHLVKGMQILFSRYKPAMTGPAVMRPVILGTDFPDLMDSLADVFVRLDSDSTMFGRRSTYLCTSCRCCCIGSVIRITHGFATIKEARSHLDLLNSNAFRVRGSLLKLTEQSVDNSRLPAAWLVASGTDAWAKRYCHLYTASRTIPLDQDTEGKELLSKRDEVMDAFKAWFLEFTTLLEKTTSSATTALRIEAFFSWFILSTLRDDNETACDRFHIEFAQTVELADQYLHYTNAIAQSCAFTLEGGILRTLYIIGLKCRDSILRRRAIDLLRSATVQEGLWSGKVFAAYVQKVADIEEQNARDLTRGVSSIAPLTYDTVPEAARVRDVVLASNDTRPALGRIIYSQQGAEPGSAIKYIEHEFQLLAL